MNELFGSVEVTITGTREIAKVKNAYDALLKELETICPTSRGLSIAKTKLEEACFHTVKEVAVLHKK